MQILPLVFALALFPAISPADPVPDFELVDMNATSPRSGETVSPRDYRHQVTAYYFGAAT